MKIYTKTGDQGDTSLFGGGRVPKHHARIEAYGTVDETNALLGLVATRCDDTDLKQAIERVQSELFAVGADLATPHHASTSHVVRVDEASIHRLESEIDAWSSSLPPLKHFILPGGSEAGATLHVARTVCRRAERALTSLAEIETVNDDAQRYLNRLSDWLFTLARVVNLRLGVNETLWQPPLPENQPEA